MKPISDIVEFQSQKTTLGQAITGRMIFQTSYQFKSEPDAYVTSIDEIGMAKEQILSDMWEELYGDIMLDFNRLMDVSRQFKSDDNYKLMQFQEELDTIKKKIRGLR